MADTAAIYNFATTLGNLRINDTTGLNFYVIDQDGAIDGLDDPAVRSVVKNSPQTDGAYVGQPFLSGYRVTFSGLCVVTSHDPYTECDAYRTAMRALESNMRDHLRAMQYDDGTLTWDGGSMLEQCRYDIQVQFTGTLLRHRFLFGISSPASGWSSV